METKVMHPNKIIMEKQYESLRIQNEEVLRRLRDFFQDKLKKMGIRYTLKYRVKSFESYYEKFLKKMKKVQEKKDVKITDILGFRVVCPFLEDIKAIEDLMEKDFKIVEEIHKGDDQSFKEFGYDSTHFLIEVPDEIKETVMMENEDLVCEIQLRTTLQDAWAEVEHEIIYKAESSLFNMPVKRKLAALNANLTLSDIIFQEIRDYQRKINNKMKKRRKTFFEKIDEENEILISEAMYKEKINETIEHEQFELSNQFTSKDTIDNLLMQALSAHNLNKFEEAINIYNLILGKNPEDFIKSIIYVHRGMAYFAISKYEEASENFSEAIEVKSFNPKAYYYRGIVNRVIKKYIEAIEDFSESIRLDRFNEDALFGRAQTYFQIGDYVNSLSDCEDVLNINPDSEDAQKFISLIRPKIKGIISTN